MNLKAHPEEKNDQVLGIDNGGRYYLNKKPIKTVDLPAMLKQIYDARTEDKILYLKADQGLNYGKVLDALDVAAKNGVRVTGMITDQVPGTRSSVVGDNPLTADKEKAAAGAPKTGGTP
jgi:biopolymer transport protein ExbD